MLDFDTLSSGVIFYIVARMAVFLLVVPLHESAHALMAHWFGDDTAKDAGRITLNPFAHLDITGFLVMLFVGVGWAKPVPVNPTNFKHRRFGLAMVSLAGPLSNLIAAFFGAAVCVIIEGMNDIQNMQELDIASGMSGAQIAETLLYFFVEINITLAVFNLIPLPPLDGFNIIRSFMPAKFDLWVFRNYRIINGAFIGLIVLSTYIPEIQFPFLIVRGFVEIMIWLAVSWLPML